MTNITNEEKIAILNTHLYDLNKSIYHLLNFDQESQEWHDELPQETKDKISSFIVDQKAKISIIESMIDDLL